MLMDQEYETMEARGQAARMSGMERLLARMVKLRCEINSDEARLNLYRDRAQCATGRASALRYSGLRSCKLEYNAINAIDLERETAQKRVKLRLMQKKLLPWLEVIRGEEARNAVYLRYISGYSVARVARVKRYSQGHAEFLLSRGREDLYREWKIRARAKASIT